MATRDDDAIPRGRWQRFGAMTGRGLGLSTAVLGRQIASFVTLKSREGREAALSRTLAKEGHKIAGLLGRMKGASMKLGQLLSADPDLVPPELAGALAGLQKDAPPMPWATVRGQLERAWGAAPETVCTHIEQHPCGAASIGQVHRATLHDGRDVAIKVQYPGIVQALESDLRNLRSLLKLSRVVIDKARAEAFEAEIRTTVLTESDYEAEAQNLARFGAVLTQPAHRDFFIVPEPIAAWTRPDVLMMSYLAGEKLDSALAAATPEVRTRASERLLGTWLTLFFEQQIVHGDPHPGNFLWTPDGRIGVLDLGTIKEVPARLSDGLLRLVAAVWDDDMPAAFRAFLALGFGKEGVEVDEALFRELVTRVLAPFTTIGPFDFGAWRPTATLRKHIVGHPSLWKLAPPSEILPVVRVASGMKGLMHRLGVALDLRTPMVALARRRGVLSSVGAAV